MRTLQDAINTIAKLEATVAENRDLIAQMGRRIIALEDGASHLSRREPCRVPSYPDELVLIGWPRPEDRIQ